MPGKLLTIIWGPVFELYGTFVKFNHLYIYYVLYFVEKISFHIVEKQVMEEKDPDLDWGKYFRIYNYREDHLNEV